jgi:hypothetical protein
MLQSTVRAAVLVGPRQVALREFPRPSVAHAIDVLAGDVPGEDAVHVSIAPKGAAGFG